MQRRLYTEKMKHSVWKELQWMCSDETPTSLDDCHVVNTTSGEVRQREGARVKNCGDVHFTEGQVEFRLTA